MEKTPLEQLEDLLNNQKEYYGTRFPQILAWIEALKPVEKSKMELMQEEITKLQAFKDFVHRRLDEIGIPTHPDGEHSKAGCRIGDRLDIVHSYYDLIRKRSIQMPFKPDLESGFGKIEDREWIGFLAWFKRNVFQAHSFGSEQYKLKGRSGIYSTIQLFNNFRESSNGHYAMQDLTARKDDIEKTLNIQIGSDAWSHFLAWARKSIIRVDVGRWRVIAEGDFEYNSVQLYKLFKDFHNR